MPAIRRASQSQPAAPPQPPSNAIDNPINATIDGTYSAEEQDTIISLRTKVNAILQVMRDRGLIRSTLPFVASQSSPYPGVTPATFANLTDGNGATGTGTNAGGLQWIEADFGALTPISAVTVAGGNLPGWGGVAGYLNGASVQLSSDRATWTTVATITGITDSGGDRTQTFTFSTVSARYARIAINGWLATTELLFS